MITRFLVEADSGSLFSILHHGPIHRLVARHQPQLPNLVALAEGAVVVGAEGVAAAGEATGVEEGEEEVAGS